MRARRTPRTSPRAAVAWTRSRQCFPPLPRLSIAAASRARAPRRTGPLLVLLLLVQGGVLHLRLQPADRPPPRPRPRGPRHRRPPPASRPRPSRRSTLPSRTAARRRGCSRKVPREPGYHLGGTGIEPEL